MGQDIVINCSPLTQKPITKVSFTVPPQPQSDRWQPFPPLSHLSQVTTGEHLPLQTHPESHALDTYDSVGLMFLSNLPASPDLTVASLPVAATDRPVESSDELTSPVSPLHTAVPSPPDRFDPETHNSSEVLGEAITRTSRPPQVTFALPPDRQVPRLPQNPSPVAETPSPTIVFEQPVPLQWSEEGDPRFDSIQDVDPTHLRIQDQEGEVIEYEFNAPQTTDDLPFDEGLDDAVEDVAPEFPPTPRRQPRDRIRETEADEEIAPASPPPAVAPPPPATPDPRGILEVNADRQTYNDNQKVIFANGNVTLRFSRAVLTADRVRVSLPNRVVYAEGNVALRRGDQVLRGEQFEYQLVQDQGIIRQARGEIYQPTSGRDLDFQLSPAEAAAIVPERPLSDRIQAQQPLQRITTSTGYTFVIGGIRVGSTSNINPTPDTIVQSVPVPGGSGQVNRLRFEADFVEFDSQGWRATNIRITNDPFSPPELEVRADTARLNRLNEFQDELLTSRSRLVFDQGFTLPIFLDRILIDRRPDDRGEGLFTFGIDGAERGGFYLTRTFTIVKTPTVLWQVSPEYYLQRAIFEEGFLDPSVFGVRSALTADLGKRTKFRGNASLTGLDLENYQNRFRASARLNHLIGDINKPHTLALEYSYRDQLFNGSLGFQTVQSNLGAVLTSPVYVLGDTGINLTYQGAIQIINADTDRADLLAPVRENNRVTLTRYQTAALLSRSFMLWQGEALPPTPEEGLRYTGTPVQPYLQLSTSVTGVASLYSNGDSQESLSGTVGLQGQVGHFSRPFFDYTGFNVSYSQSAFTNQSPFLFDRIADQRTLSFGIVQQIYGPFRLGVQSSVNLDTGQEISTDFSLEYSRRTYSLMLRYNPTLAVGSFQIRIGDFNWIGTPDPFGGSQRIRPVVNGVTQ
ncbi:DUF3769 domain-containing protein [Spirulina subsalsa FACHB-351]|uniref:DUF3769 domain-containing protein n=1 Tax=Spirulina subsalsa FACHB-351 TaxID=234711 RepID=A0ABT3L4I6_9CYAN|nr:DUF3769 domain-containing protein [Spirulina subsalsa]MCW6036390.1 DUF3769 domain-containing protein [Spirulina subsalsa FACHB-351]